MFIHKINCISPQQTWGDIDIQTLRAAEENRLYAREPVYDGIPPGILRRMGRAVRMGVGCALPLMKDSSPDGIIIGTSNGGMEDCIKFLNQIMDYEEGMLTPGNFVQSTANATAAQLGLMTANRNYNITHVHRGLAFENALLDAMMWLKENPGHNLLLEGLDEISNYNYNIDYLDGWYKDGNVQNKDLYATETKGTIAGEGAAAFIVNNNREQAIAEVKSVRTIHTNNEADLKSFLRRFLDEQISGEIIDVLVSGENGDSRYAHYYKAVEALLPDSMVVRYKHMFGEFGAGSALALWLACRQGAFPHHSIKRAMPHTAGSILIYNSYKEWQHGFILLKRMDPENS
ncbi:MAG: beta-ketoacyl synthase chain length factor [Chitinophagaceae bacterium]|nr:beta-ketoacyl synthase chain length factor [Chitinophagaceae bacterium]MCW5927628.1 beta-ketoacyl synthase chain length factor [Chitinophagaceae bacterium]